MRCKLTSYEWIVSTEHDIHINTDKQQQQQQQNNSINLIGYDFLGSSLSQMVENNIEKKNSSVDLSICL